MSREPSELLTKPAHALAGVVLSDGWQVIEKIERSPTDTGGNFSVSYTAKHEDGRTAFLKALDYSAALRRPDAAATLQFMTQSYLFERDLLNDCEARSMNRIVRIYASGTHMEPGYAHTVDYLIFEPADGDVRRALDLMTSFDTAWTLSTCHHAAVAIQQLHGGGVAHQDLKPSNVLTFGEELAKLGDLGRSSRSGSLAPHDEFPVRGEPTYAPPELLYGYLGSDWDTRCKACDVYLLGSLILFMFTRTQTTAEIMRRLPPGLRPAMYQGTFGGTYADAMPYVVYAFDEVADEFANHLRGDRAAELVDHFRQLCNPDPTLRGDARQRAQGLNPYNLQRLVSRLDVLTREANGGFLRKVTE